MVVKKTWRIENKDVKRAVRIVIEDVMILAASFSFKKLKRV